MITRLDEIAQDLKTNSDSLVLSKWKRALLYSEAKDLIGDSKKFLEYIKSSQELFGNFPDSQSERDKMLRSVRHLNEEAYCRLGPTIAHKLSGNKDWSNYPDQMKYLVDNGEKFGKGGIETAISDMKMGKQFVAPQSNSKPVNELAEVKKALDVALAKLAIKEQTYRFSEEEFFSPVEQVRDYQVLELRKGDKYAHLLFGLGDPGTFTKEDVTSTYRNLQHRYHPDHGGCPEISELLNQIREILGHKMFYLENLAEKATRAAKMSGWQEQVEAAHESMKAYKIS